MRKISATQVFNGYEFYNQSMVVVTDDNGKIMTIEKADNFSPNEIEFYDGILCPGFINAHCHLELSYMKAKIEEGKGLVQFIMDLLTIRNERMEIVLHEIEKADNEMWQNGINAVGDISNDDHTLLQKTKSKIRYHTFVESFGFLPAKASEYFDKALKVFNQAIQAGLKATITPHAPYSVPPELFKLIFAVKKNEPALFSMHNQETKAETDYFKNGEGDFKKLIEGYFKIKEQVFVASGKSSLETVLEYFPANQNILLVHNTETNASDIQYANRYSNHIYWCTCPNANLYIENKLPDYKLFGNEKVLIGTDSLASNHQLSILDEMKIIQQHAEVPTAQLLKWATSNGAAFFNWNDLGSFKMNQSPGLILVENIGDQLNLANATIRRLL